MKPLIIALPVNTLKQQGARPLSGKTGDRFAVMCGLDDTLDLWSRFEIISLTSGKDKGVSPTDPNAPEVYRRAALHHRERMFHSEPRTVLFVGAMCAHSFNLTKKYEYAEWYTWLGAHRLAKIPSPHHYNAWLRRNVELALKCQRFLRKLVKEVDSSDE